MLLPEIPRPIAISFSNRDFRIAQRIAQTLGSQSPTTEQMMGEVWLVSPLPPLLTPGFDSLTMIEPGALGSKRHWGLSVLPAIIIHSKSLLVVLSNYSAKSESVAMEISAYPDRGPLWIMPIDDTPVPEEWTKLHKIRICELPNSISLADILQEVINDAQHAAASDQLEHAYKLHWEAINIQAVVAPTDIEPLIYLHIQKARLELKLNLGPGATQTLSAAIILLDEYKEQISATPIPEDERSEEAYNLAVRKLWYFGTLVDTIYLLGHAHISICKSGELAPEELVAHAEFARKCWLDCLAVIDKVQDTDGDLPLDGFKVMREICLKLLDNSEDGQQGSD